MDYKKFEVRKDSLWFTATVTPEHKLFDAKIPVTINYSTTGPLTLSQVKLVVATLNEAIAYMEKN